MLHGPQKDPRTNRTLGDNISARCTDETQPNNTCPTLATPGNQLPCRTTTAVVHVLKANTHVPTPLGNVHVQTTRNMQ